MIEIDFFRSRRCRSLAHAAWARRCRWPDEIEEEETQTRASFTPLDFHPSCRLDFEHTFDHHHHPLCLCVQHPLLTCATRHRRHRGLRERAPVLSFAMERFALSPTRRKRDRKGGKKRGDKNGPERKRAEKD
eukprot:scaffold28261_cov112-Isochrysis_galbana.AAC.1